MLLLWFIQVFATIINNKYLTEASSYNLNNRTIITNSNTAINIQTQRYIRYYNTSYNNAKVNWTYLYSAPSPITLASCSNMWTMKNVSVSFTTETKFC